MVASKVMAVVTFLFAVTLAEIMALGSKISTLAIVVNCAILAVSVFSFGLPQVPRFD